MSSPRCFLFGEGETIQRMLECHKFPTKGGDVMINWQHFHSPGTSGDLRFGFYISLLTKILGDSGPLLNAGTIPEWLKNVLKKLGKNYRFISK